MFKLEQRFVRTKEGEEAWSENTAIYSEERFLLSTLRSPKTFQHLENEWPPSSVRKLDQTLQNLIHKGWIRQEIEHISTHKEDKLVVPLRGVNQQHQQILEEILKKSGVAGTSSAANNVSRPPSQSHFAWELKGGNKETAEDTKKIDAVSALPAQAKDESTEERALPEEWWKEHGDPNDVTSYTDEVPLDDIDNEQHLREALEAREESKVDEDDGTTFDDIEINEEDAIALLREMGLLEGGAPPPQKAAPQEQTWSPQVGEEDFLAILEAQRDPPNIPAYLDNDVTTSSTKNPLSSGADGRQEERSKKEPAIKTGAKRINSALQEQMELARMTNASRVDAKRRHEEHLAKVKQEEAERERRRAIQRSHEMAAQKGSFRSLEERLKHFKTNKEKE